MDRADQNGNRGLIRNPGEIDDSGIIPGDGITNFNRKGRSRQTLSVKAVEGFGDANAF